jgi:hypothetical protein
VSVKGSTRAFLACGAVLFAVGCGGTLDAGSDVLGEQLPVGPKNPIILCNDNVYDNWHGEYALLLAVANHQPLAGIVVSTGSQWQDLDANVSGWQGLVARARESGLTNVPDPVRSAGPILRRPTDGTIESTVANDSEGARFIVETSRRLASAERPVVVATGGRLTDVADAYLIDPTVAERIIVVSSLGTGFSESAQLARMGVPNGEEDTWSDTITIQRLRYVQVSARYDQLTDVPAERVMDLPQNPLGDWISAKRTEIFSIQLAADQVSAIAVGVPEFVKGVVRVSQLGLDRDQPTLSADPDGNAWLVSESDGAAATDRFWQLLDDPATFGN